jgi:glycosyltransferase involved in cell wall biosynthesis
VSETTAPAPDRKLRIGLALRSTSDWMGGHHYVLSCIDALLALPTEERPEIHLLWASPGARQEAEPFLDRVQGRAHLAMASRLGLDFVYPIKEILEAPSGVAWGGWIVDWQQRHLPDMFSQPEHVMREFRYRVMAESAPVVAHSSTQARDDTERWVSGASAALRVLNFRATLESDALAGDVEDVRKRYDLPPRFAVVSNQWFRHKNHPVVIEALRLLQARGLTVPCVVTGRPDDHRWPDYGPSVQRRIVELGLSDTVRLVGLVPRADQVLLIRAAAVVIQPSLFEGWSTIVEEARSLGKMIVVSDIPVHREQAPPGGHFFDPTDPASLADTLEQVWSEPSIPEATRERQAREEHAHLQAEAGRTLVEVARIGMERYDSRQHDPARILMRMAREGAHLGPEGDRTREFVVQTIHHWFGRHPWRFPGFAADVLESDDTTRGWFASRVFTRMARNGLRAEYLAWTGPSSIPLGWYPAAVDAVRDLTILADRAARSRANGHARPPAAEPSFSTRGETEAHFGTSVPAG